MEIWFPFYVYSIVIEAAVHNGHRLKFVSTDLLHMLGEFSGTKHPLECCLWRTPVHVVVLMGPGYPQLEPLVPRRAPVPLNPIGQGEALCPRNREIEAREQ